jgi:hypothetical protein
MLTVTLTGSELTHAAAVGAQRHVEAILARRPDRFGFDGSNGWQLHVEGACGELAFAKCLGVYWPGSVNTFSEPDVAGFEVKTRSEHWHDLIVRPGAKPEQRFALVTGSAPTYQVHGWCYARFAMQDRYWKAYGGRPPCWWVPANDLERFTDADLVHSVLAAS